MKRYSGEELPLNSHIIVLGSCKVGNFVVSTPVLRGLRSRFPSSSIGFIGSEVTADFELAIPEIDWRISWDSLPSETPFQFYCTLSDQISKYGSVDLAINLDGFNPVTSVICSQLSPSYVAGGVFSSNLRHKQPWGDLPAQSFLGDLDWDSPSFLERHDGFFNSNYIAELFCKLAFVSDFVDVTEISIPSSSPDFLVPDVLIHCTTARSAKIWPFDYWELVVKHLSCLGISVGLIGSPSKLQAESYNSGGSEEKLLERTDLIDLRGKTSLIELAGACKLARAVISVDAGPLHIAAASQTPTLAVVGNDSHAVGASPLRLWLPRSSNVTRTVSRTSCEKCSQNRFLNDDCLVANHPCMYSVSPDQVIQWLHTVFDDSSKG
jgi:heptosyltransferase-3